MILKFSLILQKIIINICRSYQYFLSPFLGNSCRFYPSCSEYLILAIKKHGIFKGVLMFFKRILCCHPFSSGGVDKP